MSEEKYLGQFFFPAWCGGCTLKNYIPSTIIYVNKFHASISESAVELSM